MAEKDISDDHQAGFMPQGSRGEQFLRKMVPQGALTSHSLEALAKVFSAISGVPFHRDYTRRRALMIKWFNDNIAALEPIQTLVTVAVDEASTIEEWR
jgi:hypothetical protein